MAAAPVFSLAGKRIWVAGHRGMVGSALVRRLQRDGHSVLTASRTELNLASQQAVDSWVAEQRPDVVVIAAARVGGIAANAARPVDFLEDNLLIQTNIMRASAALPVQKLLFLGSSCIYPRDAPQPMREEALLTGPLEPTNQWYAIAKIAGIMLAQAYRQQHGHDFISAMPTNLYGPGDNYDLETSHVIPALIRKAVAAQSSAAEVMTVWGSGAPLREFMHVDDLADALVFLLEHYSEAPHINIGTGHEISIADVARLIARAAGFTGRLEFDSSRPDGSPRKLMDSSRLSAMGWQPRIALDTGVADALKAFLQSAR